MNATTTNEQTVDEIENPQSLIVNRQSHPPTALPPLHTKTIDTFQIPFPKTMDQVAAITATRGYPYLKALCNRRGIHIPADDPTPTQIIPIIQQRLDRHLANRPPYT